VDVVAGVVDATGAGVVADVVADGVGDDASAAAGPATEASERPAVRVMAASAASIFFMGFGFSLGEGFVGYAPKGNARCRGYDIRPLGTAVAKHAGGVLGWG
jgi:hypothetical protein